MNVLVKILVFISIFVLGMEGNAADQAAGTPPPKQKIPMGQALPDGAENYWVLFNLRMDIENQRYAQEHPDWPKGEPAPHHSSKNALKDITGKNLLEGIGDGVKLTKEKYKDAPEEERVLQIELAIERAIVFFPLIEINPRGFTNLFYLISAVNTEAAYRNYLIRRSHPSELPDTLFSLYFQDKCKENLPEILGRYKNIIASTTDDKNVQNVALEAFDALVSNEVLNILREDREVQRLLTDKALELSPSILKMSPAPNISDENRERINTTLQILDGLLLRLQEQCSEGSKRPEWLKAKMLDFIGKSVATYPLPSSQQHIDFLLSKGRELSDLNPKP